MKICLSHMTALRALQRWSCESAVTLDEFHRLRPNSAAHLPTQMLPTSSSLRSAVASEADFLRVVADPEPDLWRDRLERYFTDLDNDDRLHLLVPLKPGVRSTKHLVFHQACLQLPPGSLVALSPNVLVCSPELLFVQMATQLEIGELIALGYELCGCYPLSPASLKVRRQLTTPQRLSSYIQHVPGMAGVRRARVAVRFVRAKSASVMETEVSALATTSLKWGGYGLPAAKLNEPLVLSPAAATIARSSHLVIDAFWPDKGIALEFDGREGHSSELDRARDSRRRDALTAEGIDFFTVTYRQLSSIMEFDEIVSQVARALGKQLRKPPTFTAAHFRLRQQLRNHHRFE